MKKLMLVDGDLAGDRRVLAAWRETGEATCIVDIRRAQSTRRLAKLQTLALLLHLILRAVGQLKPSALRKARGLSRASGHGLFEGLPACIRWLFRSARTADYLRTSRGPNWGFLYAHDLYAAAAALMIPEALDRRFVYDTHELQIHRNRKTGTLRILLEYCLEQRILKAATEVRVVNRPIADLMLRWFHCDERKLFIHDNNHFRYHPITIPAASRRPALVYVGAAVLGRQLDVIDCPPDALGFDVYVYLLGESPALKSAKTHWNVGPRDYEPHLLELVRGTRCLMWCCLDATCLSYRLATPNKFFQALAVGIPIVATQGTYLADLVMTHGIGAVYDGTNLYDIARIAVSPTFDDWVEAIARLRLALHAGTVAV